MSWFVPLGDGDGVPVYAFPHAGGGFTQFAALAAILRPHGVDVRAANLPGRQARLAEPPRTDLAGLAEELADELAGTVTADTALLGYCGGAVTALATLRALAERGAPLPGRLLVVSHEAPDIAERPWRLPRLPPDALWRFLAAEGGVSGELAADPRLRRVAEPAVRADFHMLATHRAAAGPPLPVRIAVFHGVDDPVRRGALLGWGRQSCHPVALRSVPGGHWLIEESGTELAARLVAEVVGTGAGPTIGAAAGVATGATS